MGKEKKLKNFPIAVYSKHKKDSEDMSGTKNQTICWLLRKWLSEARLTQKDAAERFGISQPTLSRQLKGLESIPLSRIKAIISVTSPSKEDLKQVSEILGENSLYEDVLANMHEEIDKTGPDSNLYWILENWRFFRTETQHEILELVRKESIWLLSGEGLYFSVLKGLPKSCRDAIIKKYGNTKALFEAIGEKNGGESIIDVVKKIEDIYKALKLGLADQKEQKEGGDEK